MPPQVIVISGPNGAGKSTFAPFLLRDTLGIEEFVNADVIAQGLSGFYPERQAWMAGRYMLEQLRRLATEKMSFAFETTLSSRSFVPWIDKLIANGYELTLFYIWLENEQRAIDRVRTRVALGGHDVPEDTIRRRYARGLTNFFSLYQPRAQRWQVYNGSGDADGVRIVAEGSYRDTVVTYNNACWQCIRKAGQS